MTDQIRNTFNPAPNVLVEWGPRTRAWYVTELDRKYISHIFGSKGEPMPWPIRKPDGDSDGTLSLRQKQMMIGRCSVLWCEIFRKQLPMAIRYQITFTLQLGFEGTLQVMARKKGSKTKYETEMPFPDSEVVLNTLKLPDEFVARLCVVV